MVASESGRPEGSGDAGHVEEETGGLLTPHERELRQQVEELREQSDRLVRGAARAMRPREFLHSFPQNPPPRGEGDSKDE